MMTAMAAGMKQVQTAMEGVLTRVRAGEFTTIDQLKGALDEIQQQMLKQMGGMAGMPGQ